MAQGSTAHVPDRISISSRSAWVTQGGPCAKRTNKTNEQKPQTKGVNLQILFKVTSENNKKNNEM